MMGRTTTSKSGNQSRKKPRSCHPTGVDRKPPRLRAIKFVTGRELHRPGILKDIHSWLSSCAVRSQVAVATGLVAIPGEDL